MVDFDNKNTSTDGSALIEFNCFYTKSTDIIYSQNIIHSIRTSLRISNVNYIVPQYE